MTPVAVGNACLLTPLLHLLYHSQVTLLPDWPEVIKEIQPCMQLGLNINAKADQKNKKNNYTK